MTGRSFLKSCCIILIAILFILQSGCGFKDIDKRSFVMSIGLDYTNHTNHPYKVTIKLAIPTGSIKEAKGTTYSYLTKESSSLSEALRIMKTYTDKDLNLGHAKVIVLGQDLLSKDINKIMDFFLRRRDIQMISWISAGKPTAEKVLKITPKSENTATSTLYNLFEGTGVESPYIISIPLFDFRRKLVERGINPVVPLIEAKEDANILAVNKAVVLTETDKTLYLNSKQTKEYNLLSSHVKRMNLKVNQDDLAFSMAVDRIKVNYKLDLAATQPKIHMNIKLVGIIEESANLLYPKNLAQYNKAAEKEMEERIIHLLEYFQNHQVDPLGFGVRFKATRLHNSDIYPTWKKIYPEVKFIVHAKCSIKSTGSIE